MRNLNEQTVTQAVLDLISGTPDPRLKFVLTSLITHLHNFAREVNLTEQ
jgi:hydroxyquinol 1,2-dioxygenase